MRPIAWRAAIFCSSSCGTAAMRRTPRDTGMKPAKNPNDEYQGMSLISSYIILYHIISYYIVLYCIILYVCMYIYICVCTCEYDSGYNSNTPQVWKEKGCSEPLSNHTIWEPRSLLSMARRPNLE